MPPPALLPAVLLPAVLLRAALAAALILAALAAPAAAQGPSWMVVTGVAADDTLTLRAEPRGDAPAVGALAPGALALATGDTARSAVDWTRVASGELQGWAASRFLAPALFRTLDDADLPVAGVCSGWEPFWGARWAEGEGTVALMRMDGADEVLPITSIPRAEGRPFGMIEAAAPDGRLVLIRYEQELCRDTALDAPVLGRGTMIVVEEGRTRWFSGCCRPLAEALAPR